MSGARYVRRSAVIARIAAALIRATWAATAAIAGYELGHFEQAWTRQDYAPQQQALALFVLVELAAVALLAASLHLLLAPLARQHSP